MGKILYRIREKIGIPSGRAIIHIIVVEIIINVIWNQVSMVFTIPIIREIGFLVLFLAGLFVVAWYLPKLSSRWSGASTGGKTEVNKGQLPMDDYSKKLADWMANALNLDENNLESFIFVHNVGVIWKHLVDTDSYFELYFEIYSSSLFRLDIGKRIDGHLLYEKEEFERSPEVRSPIVQLERGGKYKTLLRQWVSSSMMNKIALDGDKKVTFNFSETNIWVDAKYPNGKDGPKCRLLVPHEYQVRIPTQVELENQRVADKGGSQI